MAQNISGRLAILLRIIYTIQLCAQQFDIVHGELCNSCWISTVCTAQITVGVANKLHILLQMLCAVARFIIEIGTVKKSRYFAAGRAYTYLANV